MHEDIGNEEKIVDDHNYGAEGRPAVHRAEVRCRGVEVPMPVLASEQKEDREEKQIEPYRQRNEDRIGEARSWEWGGEIRARALEATC